MSLSALANEMVESDSMARADELMDLIKSPTAVATGVLIVFARDQLAKNANDLTKARSRWALVAAVLALIITGTVVAVMFPLFITVSVTNAGNGIETRLLVYGLTFLVALATVAYVASIVHDAYTDLHDATE